jgi:hypothetical protein
MVKCLTSRYIGGTFLNKRYIDGFQRITPYKCNVKIPKEKETVKTDHNTTIVQHIVFSESLSLDTTRTELLSI